MRGVVWSVSRQRGVLRVLGVTRAWWPLNPRSESRPAPRHRRRCPLPPTPFLPHPTPGTAPAVPSHPPPTPALAPAPAPPAADSAVWTSASTPRGTGQALDLWYSAATNEIVRRPQPPQGSGVEVLEAELKGSALRLVEVADGRGRGLVAKRDLQPGDRLLAESPLAAVPHDPYGGQLCHHCFGVLGRSATERPRQCQVGLGSQ